MRNIKVFGSGCVQRGKATAVTCTSETSCEGSNQGGVAKEKGLPYRKTCVFNVKE